MAGRPDKTPSPAEGGSKGVFRAVDNADQNPDVSPQVVIDLLLLEGFSLLPVTVFLEAIRLCNRLCDRLVYACTLVGLDGRPVNSSAGTALPVHSRLPDLPESDNFVVCGCPCENNCEALIRALRSYRSRGTHIGAICRGTYWLAKAGVLEGYRCTVHWEIFDYLTETFPDLQLNSELYIIDRDRFTCAGGLSILDLFLHDVHFRCSRKTLALLCNHLLYDRLRLPHERQRLPLALRSSGIPGQLTAAIGLMENALEETLPLAEIALRCGLSRRRLERLFLRYLGVSPARYYLRLRLDRARNLLWRTKMPITEIVFACGFASSSYFSKCYRWRFKRTPRQERSVVSTASQGS